MAKDPAVLFYTNDFLSGTFTMTDEQVGKYIRLLCLQHQKGKLTKKDMYYICSTYDEDVFSKFTEENGFYFNQRMYDETIRRKKYSESRKKNISKRYSKKKDSTYVEHMETETETITEDIKDINTLWIRTFGRNPNIPEYEETEKFIKKYGYDTAYKTYKAGAIRNIKSLGYLMSNIDANGNLIPYDKKPKQEEILELK